MGLVELNRESEVAENEVRVDEARALAGRPEVLLPAVGVGFVEAA